MFPPFLFKHYGCTLLFNFPFLIQLVGTCPMTAPQSTSQVGPCRFARHLKAKPIPFFRPLFLVRFEHLHSFRSHHMALVRDQTSVTFTPSLTLSFFYLYT